MVRYLLTLCICALAGLFISCGGSSDEASSETIEKPDTTVTEEPVSEPLTGEMAKTPDKAVVDEWIVDPQGNSPAGSLTLTIDNEFTLVKYQDSVTFATVNGTYTFDAGTSPFTIDMIPEDHPSLTTSDKAAMLGIFRFLPDRRAEVRFSTGAERPAEFDSTDVDNTWMLTRK